MTRRTRQTLFCLPAILMMAGCLALRGNEASPETSISSDSFSVQNYTTASVSGCQYDYRVYKPTTPSTTTSVVLGHGFLRDQNNMAGLSRALADRGIQVVTLNFCNMRLWNGHHQRNARDMRSLARQLDIADDVVFAGFSAGALAAVLAADDSTRAILALDMVDQRNQGLEAIKGLSTPLIGVSGPASSCNANSNANAVFDARKDDLQTRLVHMEGASHCDFESPSDWLCELVCAGSNRARSQIESDRKSIINDSIEELLPYLKKNESLADT